MVKKRMLCLAGIALFAAASLFPAPYTVISPGDPVLEDLRFVVRESGKSFTSLTPPLSKHEVLLILEGIDEGRLSESGRKAYRSVLQAVNPVPLLQTGFFGFDVHGEAALEGRWRSDSDIPWMKKEKTSSSVLSLPVDLYFGERLYGTIVPVLRSDPSFYDNGTNWGTNVPYETERIDLNMPFKAFMAAGGPWWNFQIGRDRLDFGSGITGNLAVSDTPDYYDFARISLFSSNIKYTFLLSQFPMALKGLIADGFTHPDMNDSTGTTQRYLYFHRIDVRLFERLSIGLSEGVMVGNSPPELRFMSPLAVFHSYFGWNDYDQTDGDLVGSMLSLDLEWAIMPSLTLYGQFVMNDYATPYERKNWPDSVSPNGLGWLAGLEYVRDIHTWRTSFFGEFMYGDPYLYVLSSPYASFISMRRLSHLTSKDPVYSWIGYPDGRDALHVTLGATVYKAPVKLGARLSFSSQGEHGVSWDWTKGEDAVNQRSPSGTAENTFKASADAEWEILRGLKLSAYLGGTFIYNYEHSGGERRIGAEAGLAVSYFY
ncbi:capsule assembly Wzi family protein [Breznakiella homolactica]|uniref:Capsule assembly protein Wzi n=1 Tax=Breznakiella homolactica TaxID=2798577 RepID=A0A7T8B9V3_9SPIR|nr:capsule assembly Wzi family protein [Breznakiella homolactica]QQO08330.1 capsule assembly Wzi family protein [Breznakiella homolactica]